MKGLLFLERFDLHQLGEREHYILQRGSGPFECVYVAELKFWGDAHVCRWQSGHYCNNMQTDTLSQLFVRGEQHVADLD